MLDENENFSILIYYVQAISNRIYNDCVGCEDIFFSFFLCCDGLYIKIINDFFFLNPNDRQRIERWINNFADGDIKLKHNLLHKKKFIIICGHKFSLVEMPKYVNVRLFFGCKSSFKNMFIMDFWESFVNDALYWVWNGGGSLKSKNRLFCSLYRHCYLRKMYTVQSAEAD